MKKIGLFFGGQSNEHEVSIDSALNIAANMDTKKYTATPIFWDKNGDFYLIRNIKKLTDRKKIGIEEFKKYIDIAFLITHGKYGEDGILQSIIESQHIPYTGCHVLSSALCMDKAIFKDFIFGYKIPQAKYAYIDFNLHDKKIIDNILKKVKKEFRLPIFVKPANSGSSCGTSKVETFSGLNEAIKAAQKHDSKVIFEEGFVGYKEIEIAILENNNLMISEPGELIVPGGFYDYKEKYKKKRTKVIIPAKVDKITTFKIKKIAEKIYHLCGCSGFARVDFFVKGRKVYVSEINTLPGFTNISMYPMLMMKTGLSYRDLISKIIELAY